MKSKLKFAVASLIAVCVCQATKPITGQEVVAKAHTAKQVAQLENRATESVEAIAKGMELNESQSQLLHATLVEKFKKNALKLSMDMSDEARQEVWQASNKAQTEALTPQFSKQQIKQVNQLLREHTQAGRIFNGKDLDGWEQLNGTATYEVIDGAIVGTTVAGSPNSFLATKKKYANFDLRFEVFLVSNELNSGVQFRSAQHTEESLQSSNKKQPIGRVFGYQCELEASAEGDMDAEKYGDAGYIYDEARRGWLVDDETRLAAKTRGAFKNQSWNRVRVLADGDSIQTWINGKKICELTDDVSASGFIALQVHGIGDKDEKWQVKWRNINVKELP